MDEIMIISWNFSDFMYKNVLPDDILVNVLRKMQTD